MSDVALLFPPLWYFAAVPADLSHTAGRLQELGLSTFAWDGSAAYTRHHFREQIAPLRHRETYGTPRHLDTTAAWYAAARRLGARFGAEVGPRHLRFPDIDESHVPRALERGRDLFRNPALPVLQDIVERIVRTPPAVVAIALVHPDQRVQVVTLSALLREAGYRGTLVWYGELEDVFAPSDFAPDLLGRHRIHDWVDGVVIGDAGDALAALARGEAVVPNYLRRGDTALPPRHRQPLTSPPVFDFVEADAHPFPTPVVDLRLGRGCPWGRCRFCGIQAHHPGYRAGPIERVVEGMRRAHRTLGSTFFRIRDDLLTPVQLRRLGEATRALDFRPRWMARARFSAGLTRGALEAASAGGLEELWLGLESAVPRVRESMDKGVPQVEIERILREGAALGLRLRALCLLGYPGETADEADATVQFLEDHQHELTAFSITPFQAVRSAPLAPSWERPDAGDRLDVVFPSPPDAAGPAAVARNADRIRALVEALDSREHGPDPAHRWWASTARNP